jgi:hypothetical protein
MQRVLLAATVLAILLLSGCSGKTATTTAPSVSTAAPAPGLVPRESAAEPRPSLLDPKALQPVLVAKTTQGIPFVPGMGGGGPGAAEPNLAVGPDGAFYASNPCAVWRSDDQGKTWKETAHEGQTGCGDGDIALDASGRLYWLGLGGGIPFQVSTDRGESFTKSVDISNKTGADREWIDATPDGKVYTSWRGADAEGNSIMEARTSLDGGATWLPKVNAAPDGDGGPVVHDPVSGRLYLPVADFAAQTGLAKPVMHVYTSVDDGRTWAGKDTATLPRGSPVETNGYASDFPVVAVDTNGTAYLVYSADSSALPGGQTPPEVGAVYGIFLQVSRDGGQTWSAPLKVSPAGKDARMPWVTAGKPGRVAIAWYEGTLGVPGENIPDEWNVRMWESVTADQAAPASKSVLLTPTPNHIGSLCTAGTTCAAGGDRSLLDYFEIALTPAGQPIAVWSSSLGGTGVGIAAQGTDVYFGGIAEGTPLA